METFRGIDVSAFNGEIDWKKVAGDDIEFVMIRSSYGKNHWQVDKRLSANASGASEMGIPFGFYHYCYAQTVEDALLEAELFLNAIGDYSPDMPVAYDVEDASLEKLSREELTDVALTFMRRVQSAGYYTMLYSSLNWIENRFYMDRLSGFDVWLAHYSDTPDYDGNYGIWQYSSSGSVAGIFGRVDMDVANKNYPKLISLGGESRFGRYETVDDMPDWAVPTIERLIAMNALRGDGRGLNLSEDMLRVFVISDRAGAYDR